MELGSGDRLPPPTCVAPIAPMASVTVHENEAKKKPAGASSQVEAQNQKRLWVERIVTYSFFIRAITH